MKTYACIHQHSAGGVVGGRGEVFYVGKCCSATGRNMLPKSRSPVNGLVQVMNPRQTFYQRMLAAAGLPEASNGTWSDSMIDATVLWGDESMVAGKLEALFALGATEILAPPYTPEVIGHPRSSAH